MCGISHSRDAKCSFLNWLRLQLPPPPPNEVNFSHNNIIVNNTYYSLSIGLKYEYKKIIQHVCSDSRLSLTRAKAKFEFICIEENFIELSCHNSHR